MAEIGSYQKDIQQIFNKELPWSKLSGGNILVAGATGLIGGCLVEALMVNPHRDYHVFALGRNEDRAIQRFKVFLNDSRFHFIKHDVTSPLDCNIQFDYIINAASGSAPNDFSKHPVEVMKVNLWGVSNLLDYGKEHGIKRMLYISSGEVYGEGDGRTFSEDYLGYVDINSPRSCYPSAKRAAETLCAAYADEYGIDVVIARPCHIYGPHFTENDNRVYAQFIRNIINNEDIVLKSRGKQLRSWCYVVDCVEALLYILLKGEKGNVYNIADNNSNITIKEFAELFAKIGGQRVVYDFPSEVERKVFNTVSRSVLSIEKLQSLGWIIKGSVQQKMYHTINECK